MNTVKKIALSRLNPVELSHTGTLLCSFMEPLLSDAHVSRQVHAITDALNELMKIANTPQGSELTDEIHDEDHEVDELLLICLDDLESSISKKRFFPMKAEAAAALKVLFDKRDRKKLLFGGYTDQGNEIRSLFSELFSEPFKTYREESGAAPIFNELKARFARLSELLEARLNEGKLPTTSKEQRGILRYRLGKLLSYIDVNIFDDIAGFADVKTPVNELITDIMSQYRARMTRKENKTAQ